MLDLISKSTLRGFQRWQRILIPACGLKFIVLKNLKLELNVFTPVHEWTFLQLFFFFFVYVILFPTETIILNIWDLTMANRTFLWHFSWHGNFLEKENTLNTNLSYVSTKLVILALLKFHRKRSICHGQIPNVWYLSFLYLKALDARNMNMKTKLSLALLFTRYKSLTIESKKEKHEQDSVPHTHLPQMLFQSKPYAFIILVFFIP